jgi:hypothetical protein
VKAVGRYARGAKDFITTKPATLNATGTGGFIVSGHTHGQPWAAVTLAGLALAAETLQKIYDRTRRRGLFRGGVPGA